MDNLENRITADFLDVSCRRLEMITNSLETCMKKVTDEQSWQRQGSYENAVGNLVLHLCGNARQWIIHGVGGAADVRERDKEFSADGGMTGADLVALFGKTCGGGRGEIAVSA